MTEIKSINTIQMAGLRLEAHGKITIQATFDPPIPAGTKIRFTAESESAFMWHGVDWKD